MEFLAHLLMKGGYQPVKGPPRKGDILIAATLEDAPGWAREPGSVHIHRASDGTETGFFLILRPGRGVKLQN